MSICSDLVLNRYLDPMNWFEQEFKHAALWHKIIFVLSTRRLRPLDTSYTSGLQNLGSLPFSHSEKATSGVIYGFTDRQPDRPFWMFR